MTGPEIRVFGPDTLPEGHEEWTEEQHAERMDLVLCTVFGVSKEESRQWQLKGETDE